MFANITAGHIIILSLVGLIFLFGNDGESAGGAAAGAAAKAARTAAAEPQNCENGQAAPDRFYACHQFTVVT